MPPKQLSRCCKAEIELTWEDRPNHFKCNECGRIIWEPYEIKYIVRERDLQRLWTHLVEQRLTDKINELIDAVNQLQSNQEELYGYQEEVENVYIPSINNQIKALQKKMVCAENAPTIENGATVQTSSNEEPVEELLIPDKIKFSLAKPWYWGMWLWFWDKHELYYDIQLGMWIVTDRYNKKARCKLVPCKLEDIEVGEWVYRKQFPIDDISSYFLRESWYDYVYVEKWQIKRRTNYTDDTVYKVVPCE